MPGPRRTNARGKRPPLSDELYEVRTKLGETQEQFARRFGIKRTAYLGWERYYPPQHVGMRGWIALILARARRETTKGKRKKERRESTCSS